MEGRPARGRTRFEIGVTGQKLVVDRDHCLPPWKMTGRWWPDRLLPGCTRKGERFDSAFFRQSDLGPQSVNGDAALL